MLRCKLISPYFFSVSYSSESLFSCFWCYKLLFLTICWVFSFIIIDWSCTHNIWIYNYFDFLLITYKENLGFKFNEHIRNIDSHHPPDCDVNFLWLFSLPFLCRQHHSLNAPLTNQVPMNPAVNWQSLKQHMIQRCLKNAKCFFFQRAHFIQGGK